MARRRSIITGACVALGLIPGCVGARLRRERIAEESATAAVRRELSQNAMIAMDRGDYVLARSDLVLLVSKFPRSAEMHYRLGKVEQLQGDLQAAADSFRKALAIEPEYVVALVGLGQVDFRLGRASEALGRFNTAIELDPHQAEAHFARGEALEALGRPDDALAAYFRSLELNPGSPPTILRAATLQLGRGQPEQALVRLDRATELAPDDVEVRFRRGMAHLALNHPRLAVDDLSFAAEQLRDRPDVLVGLAQALELDRQVDRARLAAERALRIEPGSALAREIADRLRR